MDYSLFYKEINIKKQLNKLNKKYKKVIIYGAGIMSNVLFSGYKNDLEQFDIVAVCDRKYKEIKNETYFGHPAISPDELENYDFDAILVNLKYTNSVIRNLRDGLIDTKNEERYVGRIYKIPFLYFLKYICCR